MTGLTLDSLAAEDTDCSFLFLLSFRATEPSTKQLLRIMSWMDLNAPKQAMLGSTLTKLPNSRRMDFFKSVCCSLETQGRNQGSLFCSAELAGLPEEQGRWDWAGREGSGHGCWVALVCGTVRISPDAPGWLKLCVGRGSAQVPLRAFSFLPSV